MEDSLLTYRLSCTQEIMDKLYSISGSSIVVNYDYCMFELDNNFSKSFASDIIMLKKLGINVIVILGSDFSCKRYIVDKIENTSQIAGTLVMDSVAVKELERSMCGEISYSLAKMINDLDKGSALSLSGRDCNLVSANKIKAIKNYRKSNVKEIIDIGLIGDPTGINRDFMFNIIDSESIPIISPICECEEGDILYVNPIVMSYRIADTIEARKMVVINYYPDNHSEDLVNNNTSIVKEIRQDCTSVDVTLYTPITTNPLISALIQDNNLLNDYT